MWLNDEKIIDSAIASYRKSLLGACPNHVVIDDLFDPIKLDAVIRALQQPDHWQIQQHTYDALYVDEDVWQQASPEQRFVQRDSWQARNVSAYNPDIKIAQDFLRYLRSDAFMSFLSRLFKVTITDMNVADPDINTNYFRLASADFVQQHADDSPGREICMLLYLNKDWQLNAGGELEFIGQHDQTISIAPLFNRCILFDPFSEGSEHWVKKVNSHDDQTYRYNVTSWYWSE